MNANGENPNFGGLTDSQLNAITATLDAFEGISCAYLFGSAVQGRMGPLSDVDIGVLLKSTTAGADILLELESRLSQCIEQRDIDLVLLNEAPCHLAYKILRDGYLLVNHSPVEKETFEVHSITRYLDMKPMREALFRTNRKQILRTA